MIGGTTIVNDKIKNTIKNPTRPYGSNRYRTDQNDTIIVTTDGNNLSFNVKPVTNY